MLDSKFEYKITDKTSTSELCKGCIHTDVCMYKNDTVEEVRKIDISKLPSFIVVDIKCKLKTYGSSIR